MNPVLVGDLAEVELISRIQHTLPPRPDWMLVGIGDDAAVVEPERNRVEVLTVDALVEGVHFDRAFVPPEAIGHRALAVNLSDLAAMGASPRLALLSMALPATLPLADFDGIIAGFAALAARYHLHLAGGNLTRTPGPLMLDVTVTGTVKRRQALRRGTARPGDALYVSGTIGDAGAGLQMLKAQHEPSTTEARCVDRYLRPEPRVRLGTLLSRNRAATACMDLSDGLADAIRQVAQASGVGAIVDLNALPIDPVVRGWFDRSGLDPVVEAMRAGDDYELLVTAGPRSLRRLAGATRRADIPLTRIGVCTEAPEIVLRSVRDGVTIDAPLPKGYGHFR